MKLIITLPAAASMSPNKLLGRSFWVYATHKKKCGQWLADWEGGLSEDSYGHLCDYLNHIEEEKPHVHLHIDAYGCSPKDCDNAVAGCKALIDVLRQSKYIIDDNPTSMSLSVNSLKVNKRKDEKLVITLLVGQVPDEWLKGR